MKQTNPLALIKTMELTNNEKLALAHVLLGEVALDENNETLINISDMLFHQFVIR